VNWPRRSATCFSRLKSRQRQWEPSRNRNNRPGLGLISWRRYRLAATVRILAMRREAGRGLIAYLGSWCSRQTKRVTPMPKPNLTLQGEMSVQPLEHGSTAASPSLPTMPTADRKATAASPVKRRKDDSLADANEVTRRNSLRKRRRAMKVQGFPA
jgi:hypothetical protein